MPRLTFFAILAAALAVLVAALAPQQLPVIIYKFALVTLAAVLGYWLDRHLFPYGRPHALIHTDAAFGWAMMRRAIIVVGTMIAFGLAL